MANRKLIDYLPFYMQQYLEILQITDTEQTEIDAIWEEATKAWSNQFVETTDETGIARWEKAYRVSPLDTDTLQDRRLKVKSAINQDTPYTRTKLDEILTTICGAGNFDVAISGYNITVKLALGIRSQYDAVEKLLNRIIPCNMSRSIEIRWNTHDKLREHTYDDLSGYTHTELREDTSI